MPITCYTSRNNFAAPRHQVATYRSQFDLFLGLALSVRTSYNYFNTVAYLHLVLLYYCFLKIDAKNY